MSKFSEKLEDSDPLKIELDSLRKQRGISARQIQKLNEQVSSLTNTI